MAISRMILESFFLRMVHSENLASDFPIPIPFHSGLILVFQPQNPSFSFPFPFWKSGLPNLANALFGVPNWKHFMIVLFLACQFVCWAAKTLPFLSPAVRMTHSRMKSGFSFPEWFIPILLHSENPAPNFPILIPILSFWFHSAHSFSFWKRMRFQNDSRMIAITENYSISNP